VYFAPVAVAPMAAAPVAATTPDPLSSYYVAQIVSFLRGWVIYQLFLHTFFTDLFKRRSLYKGIIRYGYFIEEEETY
jgi:hypothetical protein